jgi:NADPH-dependent 2,4-dienoyl-CoA reductase/sulfur reductase-like enzyme/ferredoxin
VALLQIADNPFRNFTESAQPLPRWLWQILRVLAVAVVLALTYGLVTRPAMTLVLFWGLLVPSLPLLFMIAPGIWRNVCPMGFMNQIPRMLGRSREGTLSRAGRENAFIVAVLAFFVIVSSRHLIFNHDALALAGVLLLTLVLPLIGGVLYKGKSGWCGTFCPVAPIQKAYGQAALVRVDNEYCSPCLGCQKNCYDFNPNAAVYADLGDDSEWYTGHRKLFFGALPGFILAYFTASEALGSGIGAYLAHMSGSVLLSLGLFHLAAYLLPLPLLRVVQLFTAVGFVMFYYFALPVMAASAETLTGIAVPEFLVQTLRVLPALVALTMLLRGLKLDEAYRRFATESSVARVSGGIARLRERVQAKASSVEIRETSSGQTLHADAGTPLLDALEAARLPINPGCRMGMCGADPVAILEGHENLEPMGEAERETLARLGLQGVRLACMCRLHGPVSVSVDPADALAPGEVDAADAALAAEDEDTERFVVIGNGVAGVTFIDTLRKKGSSARIDLVTQESHHFYNRMGIERLVYGRTGMDGLYLMSDDWYAEHRVTTWLNTVADAVDREAHEVRLATGDSLRYDKLVLACGASAFMPPLPGHDLPGAFVVREARDAMRLREYHQLNRCRNAVVLGGGVLGIEMADALRQLGLRVTIVNRSGWLMDRQLDARAAGRLAEFLNTMGIRVRLNAGVKELRGDDRVEVAILDDGTGIDTDIFCACTGVRPNIGLAEQCGLTLGRGVQVSESMQSSDPDIYAIGDVAELPGMVSGLWPVSLEHGKTAAAHLMGEHYTPKLDQVVVRLKLSGIDVQSCGRVIPASDEDEVIQDGDADGSRWRRLVVAGGVIQGANFVDCPGTARITLQLIADGTRLDDAVLSRLREGDWSALDEAPPASGA